MPTGDVRKEAGKIQKFGKRGVQNPTSTERALRAKSLRINPESLKHIDVNTEEHDLGYLIDYREDAESAFPLQPMLPTWSQGIALREKQIMTLPEPKQLCPLITS